MRYLSTRTCPHRHVVVFETKEGRGDVPEHQNEPTWARSGVQDEGKGEGEGKGGGRWWEGQRLVGRAEGNPDMKNVTLWSRFSCLGGRRGRGHPRHKERDLVVAFFVFGW